jgi:hypothetical protein
MPSITDLVPGTIYEGKEGDRWIVGEGIQSENSIQVVLTKLKVEQEIIENELL